MAQTVKTELARAKDLLRAEAIPTPGLDAGLLLAHALGISRIDLIVHRDRELSEQEILSFDAFLARRLCKEPIAYILGEKEFFGRPFQVSPHVLIPRPETEALVELSLALAPEGGSVLEIGVGSGAVIVSLLCERGDLTGCGQDISPKAVRLTRANAQAHGVASRLHLYVGDVFDGLKAFFPLILANPPYIAREEEDSLDDDVRLYEPVNALFGGKDGLDIVKEIIGAVPGHLTPGGMLIMEVGQGQQHAVDRMVSCREGLRVRRWVNDLAGIPRTVVIERVHG